MRSLYSRFLICFLASFGLTGFALAQDENERLDTLLGKAANQPNDLYDLEDLSKDPPTTNKLSHIARNTNPYFELSLGRFNMGESYVFEENSSDIVAESKKYEPAAQYGFSTGIHFNATPVYFADINAGVKLHYTDVEANYGLNIDTLSLSETQKTSLTEFSLAALLGRNLGKRAHIAGGARYGIINIYEDTAGVNLSGDGLTLGTVETTKSNTLSFVAPEVVLGVNVTENISLFGRANYYLLKSRDGDFRATDDASSFNFGVRFTY